jgi:hypothetical protein
MTLSDLQRTVVKEAYAAYFKAPSNAQKAHAKTVMQDPQATATSVLIAAHYLLGPTFLAYEPETLWLELDPCLANRDKLMAAIALAMTPSFYWDYRVFGATAHAFTNEMVIPESVPKCDAGQMAWACFEAELIYALTDTGNSVPEFDPCIEAYVAVSLWDEGFATTPSGLGFANEELQAKVSKEALTLKDETEKAWAALHKEKLEHHRFEDSPLGAQLAKLATSWVHVAGKTSQLRSQITALLG